VLVDGLVGVEGIGPDAPPGLPVEQGLVVLGTNGVATDAVTASIMGYKVEDIDHLRFASERGCGPLDLSAITIKGLSITHVAQQHKWEHPPREMKEITLLQYSDGVLDGAPCSACVGGIFRVLTGMERKDELSKLEGWTLVMGSNAKEMLKEVDFEKQKLLVVGRCCKPAATLAEHEGAEVIFVAGCPPIPAQLNEMLAKLGASPMFE
jgi:hypothetical protein